MPTDRSEEVRRLIQQGLPIREIALRLGISRSRVHQIASGERMEVRLRQTRTGVTLSSRGTSPEALAARVKRALELAKIDVLDDARAGD